MRTRKPDQGRREPLVGGAITRSLRSALLGAVATAVAAGAWGADRDQTKLPSTASTEQPAPTLDLTLAPLFPAAAEPTSPAGHLLLQPTGQRPRPEQRNTAVLVPLGVPMERTVALEEENSERNERLATAAFKVRLQLPGGLGERLGARVQSLRLTRDQIGGNTAVLGNDDVGPLLLPPGGPGWPEVEHTVTLVRLGNDAVDSEIDGASGRLSRTYNLYESEETILLLADPRARRAYLRQELPEGAVADATDREQDEQSQCRRCDYPSYLPDPASATPQPGDAEALEQILELLAGPTVRATLWVDPEPGNAQAQQVAADTERALQQLDDAGLRRPVGLVEAAAWAAPVPSPLQASLAEPAQQAAFWSAGEAGVSVSLSAGEALLAATDFAAAGRVLPLEIARTYRSGTLGYGPLGSAGWHGNVFAQLREIPPTGEVEYHDGSGNVWRFFPANEDPPDERFAEDGSSAASYHPPQGLYLRLAKLSGNRGWRLVDRHRNAMVFDGAGRLAEISDRHRQLAGVNERGNSLVFRYGYFGQLATITDDLGRTSRFEYQEDPADPDYGLLERFVDWDEREVEYIWDDQRRLEQVRLVEIDNPSARYSDVTWQGSDRPTVRYGYAPTTNVTSQDDATTAVLHGEFAQLRLASMRLPDFLGASGGAAGGGDDVERVRWEYDPVTGRLSALSFPTSQNTHPEGGGVRWQFDYTEAVGGAESNAGRVTQCTLTEPWGHELRYELEGGRVTRLTQLLEITEAQGAITASSVERTFSYDDPSGRLVSTTLEDGAVLTRCYADGVGCGSGGGFQDPESTPDRLAERNVTRVDHAPGSADPGPATHGTISTLASYQSDNLVAASTDGRDREVTLAVPSAEASDVEQATPAEYPSDITGAELVPRAGATFSYDAFGRPASSTSFGFPAVEVAWRYGQNRRGDDGAGLLREIDRGGITERYRYDDRDNVDEITTSYNTRAEFLYDAWDRPVREVTGLGNGVFAPVGAGAGERGAVIERAFDAAGHLIRERRLQDFLPPTAGGNDVPQQRWVETRYFYDAREQLVRRQTSYLSSPTDPGEVLPGLTETERFEFDAFGRLERVVAVNQISPDLETTIRYDAAGRVAGVTVGDAGERVTGYDERSRTVYRTDGHEATWFTSWDAWDRPYEERHPTGAVVTRRFDAAHQLQEETVRTSDGELLARSRMDWSVAGLPVRSAVQQSQASDFPGATDSWLGVAHRYDATGRRVATLSGPADEQGVLEAGARLEQAVVYEHLTGRIVERSSGGEPGAPLHRADLTYPDGSWWAQTQQEHEVVPGEGLRATWFTAWTLDAFGRPLTTARSDGTVRSSVFDRGGSAIRSTTGAGAASTWARDGRGLVLAEVRPTGRGRTLHAYDLDGRHLARSASNASGSNWLDLYAYDRTGRVERIDHADGTAEQFTYQPDNTLATHTLRDGVVVTHDYDPANRLLSLQPTAPANGSGPADPDDPAGLVAIGSSSVVVDAGDSFSWDQLSRRLEAQRGRLGATALDPALRVGVTGYDLGSRPLAEIVGSRAALAWQWDEWSRPVEVELPAVMRVGGGSGSGFTGFQRTFDTADRQQTLGALGAEPVTGGAQIGASWHWGGHGGGGTGTSRLHGMTTNGFGDAGTSMRRGFQTGTGPQGSDDRDGASPWKMSRQAWGTGSSSSPTELSDTWGAWDFGWRGAGGAAGASTPGDGLKTARTAAGLAGNNQLAGLGWRATYDNAERVASVTGASDTSGFAEAGLSPELTASYGEGDELQRLGRTGSGPLAGAEEFTHGPNGRITARAGTAYSYDPLGRRSEDERHVYTWDWRSQLVQVDVRDDASGEDPFAGHRIELRYDATGRMTSRLHWAEDGSGSGGSGNGATRAFIERRDLLWEGPSLLGEVASGTPEGVESAAADGTLGALRWRRTWVPGPTGLDDPAQVVVEVPGGPSAGTRTFTYLRDDQNSVAALVREPQTAGEEPQIAARFHYGIYGRGFVETSPLLLRATFAAEQALLPADTLQGPATTLRSGGGSPNGGLQGVALAALGDPFAGVALLEFSLPVRAWGVVVERSVDGTWQPVDVDLAPIFGADAAAPLPETSTRLLVRSPQAADGDPPLPLVWRLGERYRVRLTSALTDLLDRPFNPAAQSASAGATPVDIAVEFVLPEQLDDPLSFRAEVLRPVAFDTRRAAAEDLSGEMPGGVNTLYQGLWTDPVTGLSYARARWLDTETASFLSEDPLGDVDSPNLYAFVANSPMNGVDPWGLCRWGDWDWKCTWWVASGTVTNLLTSRETYVTLAEELSPVGVYNGVATAATGRDYLREGESVGWAGRGLAVVGALPGVPSAVRRLDELGDAAATAERASRRGEDVAEVFEEATRGPLPKSADELGGGMREISPPEFHTLLGVERHHPVFKMFLRAADKAGVDVTTLAGSLRPQKLVELSTNFHRELHELWDVMNPALARGAGASDRVGDLMRRGEVDLPEILDDLEDFYRVVMSDHPQQLEAVLNSMSSLRRRIEQ